MLGDCLRDLPGMTDVVKSATSWIGALGTTGNSGFSPGSSIALPLGRESMSSIVSMTSFRITSEWSLDGGSAGAAEVAGLMVLDFGVSPMSSIVSSPANGRIVTVGSKGAGLA